MSIRSTFLLSALLLPACAEAQVFSPGLVVGIPLNHALASTAGYSEATGRYTFGLSAGIRLGRRFAFDAELLYRRIDFGLTPGSDLAAAHRLELPMMLRYRIPGLRLRPFVHAGISFNRIIAVNGADMCKHTALGEEVYCIGGTAAAILRHRHTHGPLAGIGLSFRWRRIELSPELRITRWIDRSFGTQDSPLRSNLTAIDLLCGFRF